MFSLPMIAPRPDASLWPSHRTSHTAFDDSSPPTANTNAQRRPTSHHGPHHSHARASTAFLAALTNDENMIDQRKQNVRRFGAGWLRPPGVAKTLQAMKDEELEKEEQEMMQRREQVMLDLSAAQQEAANQEQREQGEQIEAPGNEDRDLDDDVPEADASDSEASHSADSDSDADSNSGSDASGSAAAHNTTVPFNEDSFLEGSTMEAHVSHMLEREQAEIAGVLQDERDLDDDVPEAGSYEHTDSELDEASDVESSVLLPRPVASVPAVRSARRGSRRGSGRTSAGLPSGFQAGGVGATAGRVSLGVDLGQGRSSFGVDGSSSFMDGSSFLRSSPAGAAAATRGTLRDRFLGAARGGGRGG